MMDCTPLLEILELVRLRQPLSPPTPAEEKLTLSYRPPVADVFLLCWLAFVLVLSSS